MAKSKAAEQPTDWENATQQTDGEWESLSSGFAPLWKPEQGDAIMVLPVGVHPFTVKKASKIKGASFAIECILKGGSTTSFYNGKGTAIAVRVGDNVTIGSSYNLVGEDKLVVIETPKKGSATARLSEMADLLTKESKSFRIVFNGKIKLQGARSVNDYTMQVPRGYKEKFSQHKG